MSLTFRDPIRHFYQEKSHSCAAAAFAMLFNLDEKVARKMVKTDSNGTCMYDVLDALLNHDVGAYLVGNLGEANHKTLFWLGPLSCHFPLLLSCKFLNTSIHKRTIKRQHAVLAANGFIYDPSEDREVPIEAFEGTFNKDLIISQMIVVDHELPRWRDNWLRAGFDR